METPLRDIPPVHRFTTDPAVAVYDALIGRANVRSRIQTILEDARKSAAGGNRLPTFEMLRSAMLVQLAASQLSDLVSVINGTGVLLHTNFGRAPLAASALANASALGAGYTNLEYDLEEGKRGSRYERVSLQLRELSGAQAALVVNNCAAAVLLVLDTFARDREVVVSRGQLIEIGGGFRLPDVLRKSGAKLVEVGSTNKTYPHDYRNGWSAATAMFMRSHPSNYRIEGFTAEVDAKTVAALAKEMGVISFEDLGSGAFVNFEDFGLPHEPTVAEEIVAGFDVVAVSGDKLLGGPQCGIICGNAELIETMKLNPLLRALRVDKFTLAALSATLRLYLEPNRLHEIPLFAMLKTSTAELRARAAAICKMAGAIVESGPEGPLLQSDAVHVEPRDTEATTGGGTLPLARIPSAGIAVSAAAYKPDQIAKRLRRHSPPVIGRVEETAFVIDLRTVLPKEDQALALALGSLYSE